MTQTLPKPSKTPLYDRDLNLWLESAIAKLKCGDLQNLDIANIVEELEGLTGRDKPELKKMLWDEYFESAWGYAFEKVREIIRGDLKYHHLLPTDDQ